MSGGPDSLALLILAHAAFTGRFEVATVDHGLRPESAEEATMVARLCAERGIDHATLRAEVARKGNLQANARAARYRALGDWACESRLTAIVTAHHLDDQAETLLMRLNRGAGVRGLAGMRAIAAVPGRLELPLLRPLLGWTRAELARIVAESGFSPAADPSNRDTRFERAAMRQALTRAEWLDPAALAASARHLAEAEEALVWAAAREWLERVERRPDGFAYRPAAPRAIRLRVLERILAEISREGAPRGSEIARLDRCLAGSGTATLAGVRASTDGAAWIFVPAPARRSARRSH